nr:hypothetical protein [Kibdelosporangium sp. MJ126-NF4]
MSRKMDKAEHAPSASRQPPASVILDEESRSIRQRISAAVVILSSLALTVAALVDIPGFTSTSRQNQLVEGFLRIFIVVVAGILITHLARHRDHPDLSRLKPDEAAPMPASIKELIEAEDFVVRHYGEEAIRYFSRTLLDLSSYLARVDEEFAPAHRNVLVKTALTFRTIESRNLGTSEAGARQVLGTDQRVLVPVLAAEEDRLIDNLGVCDASGRTLPLLPRWEVRGLITATLRMYLEQQVLRLPKVNQEDGLPELAKEVLTWVLMDAVCAVGERSVSVRQDGSPKRTTAQAAALEALWELRELGMLAETIWEMRYLCEALADQYLTVCEISPSGGVNTVVKYCYTYPSQVLVGSGYERSRAKRGLDPSRFDLTMSRALETDSYHLQFTAPESQYVHSHHLERADGTIVRARELTIAGVSQFVRHYHEEGRSVAHAHTRRRGISRGVRGSTTQGHSLTSVVRVREVPPGTLGSTFLLSLVTTAVIIFVTATRIGLEGQSGNANLPALLLAIPAFLAGTLGKGVDSARLARTPMLTYYGLSATGFLSFSAALLYVLDAAYNLNTGVAISLLGNSVQLHADWPWITLSFLSLSVFIFLLREKRDQTWYYLNSLRNSVDRNGA